PKKLIAGPTVFICDECIQVCNDIIRAENEPSPRAVAPPLSSSTYLTQVVTCKLCGRQLPLEDALVISESAGSYVQGAAAKSRLHSRRNEKRPVRRRFNRTAYCDNLKFLIRIGAALPSQ